MHKRHNAGAWYVDLLAERHNQPLKEEAKFLVIPLALI